MYVRSPSTRVKLLIVQPTPFCNIDCRYCYLPGRDNRAAMRLDDLAAILCRLNADGVIADKLEMCWHAGEPLVVGIDFYREAQEILRTCLPPATKIIQKIQTNGTLIDERWCEMFRDYDIRVGLSLDGPKPAHDRNRVTRSGAGTYDRTLRAVELLKSFGITPYALCVVDAGALESAAELYDFFAGLGFEEICFNIEETDGVNVSNALDRPDLKEASRRFFGTLLTRIENRSARTWVRELHRMLGSITLATEDHRAEVASYLTDPLETISVAYDGRWSTFSPELLGIKSAVYEDFFFGNLLRESLDVGIARPHFQRLLGEITAGVGKCRETCSYFRLCGGGAPSNKWGETGAFDTTETSYCRAWTQGLADACLDFVEGTLAAPAEPRA
jgi:uncharacterized protein